MMRRAVIVILALLTICLSGQALALEAGGELAIDFDDRLKESMELELFLPQFGDTELRYAFILDRPVQDLLEGRGVSYFAKKLYLKHRFPGFHLTVGRQPISWAFGSLLNPADYTLGSVALGQEYSSKYTDAVEVYIPVNWNSSLSVVTSFPDGFISDAKKIKWGSRARMGIGGYDFTVNYVREAEARTQQIPGQRLGFTFKGDLGDLGVYGAYAHQFCDSNKSSNKYLLGADYSYNLDYATKITMQVEYLASGSGDQDLLVGSIGYPIDDFSAVSVIATVYLVDGSIALTPRYQNTLPGGIDLMVDSTFMTNQDSVASLRLSYPF